MGAQRNACIMKCVAVIATLVVFASAAPMFSDVAEEVEFAQEEASPSLSSAVSFLQNVAPANVNYHVARVAKHAELLQGYKAKAYAHNFESSKAAIKAALKSLTNELNNGHNHDKNVLSKEKSRLEINVAIKNNGRICQCQTGGISLRPCIGHTNSNWGGWGNSCGGKVKQTMSVSAN